MALIRTLLLLLSLGLTLAAPLAAQDSPISTEEGTSAATQAETDAAIATRIRDILHELDGYEDVTVTVSSGIVTLRGTTLDAALVEELGALVGRVEHVVAIENEVMLSTSVSERLEPVWQRLVTRAQQALAFLPLIAVALVAFLLVTWAGFALARRHQPWDRLAPNAFIADIYRNIMRLVSVMAGVVVGLDILGATALLSTILGAAGIVGLAIGFAVRDTVENFIASILLSIRQPFRPNDAIEIDGVEGKVIRLTSRATVVLNWDGNHVRIPNATVFKARILNYSRNPQRRFSFELGVAYGTDLAGAKDLAETTVAALPFVLQSPAVNSWTTTLNGSDIGMTVVGWIDQRETDLLAARSEAIRQVLLAFEAAGIEMPEPTYRLIGAGPGTGGGSGPGTGRGAIAAESPARPAPDPALASKVQDVAAGAEQELERMVNDERAASGPDDLLTHGERSE
ncbi:MAG: mechanosensitive ion channel protein MscS [Rhodobacterales bacterium]|nr:MAG: mechanosensitive ion channel protein MscS [Rhodobacterales bacterium]